MRLQSAIFDMDGTLLDSMGAWDDVTPRLLRSMGVTPEEGLTHKLNSMTVAQASAYCCETYHLDITADQLIELVEREVEDFYFHKVQAKPGLEKFLSILKMEGVWMYIATGTTRRLAEAGLRCAGIDQYFRGMLTCPEVGTTKESPEIFEMALRRLRSTKKDTVVFEDSLHAIKTAKAAGFRVAAVYDPASEVDQEEIKQLADYYITSFEEMFSSELL